MKASSFIIASLLSVAAGLAIVASMLTSSPTEALAAIPESGSTTSATSSAAVTSTPVAPMPVTIAPLAAAPLQALQTPVRVAKVPSTDAPTTPTGISIPAIGLDSKVIPVSTNAKGEMSVPNGSTSDIGWYADGVVPGNEGSAVMDAHVFAGFSRLHELKKGDDVYVADANGNRRHFIVIDTELYALSSLTPAMLFQATDGRQLNLITCEGSLTSDRSTYDHRRIVYTALAE